MGMAPGNIDRESETRNSNANYNRDKPRKPFLRMPTQMQNKIENAGSGAAAGPEDDFSLDLLDEAQMARLKRAFCIFDKDDSGKISHQEMMGVRPRGRPFRPLPRMPAHLPPAPRSLCQVLRLLGTNPTNGELEDIIRGIDLNQDGFIDFLEFARVWWVREQQNIEADFDIELELAFKVHHNLLQRPPSHPHRPPPLVAPRFALRAAPRGRSLRTLAAAPPLAAAGAGPYVQGVLYRGSLLCEGAGYG